MDRSDDETQFRGAIRVRDSRRTPLLVFGAVALVASIGVVANLTGDASSSPSSPSVRAPMAAASPSAALAPPSSRPSDARPTPGPAADPTPLPTLAPVAAPATDADLAPTGVLVAQIRNNSVASVVSDVDGSVWVAAGGGLARLDPQTGEGRAWTIADDAAFATTQLAESRRGGVWLVGPGTIRLFDGERFPVVIEMPTAIWTLVEGPDGSLWAQTDPFGLIRWTDGVWASDPPGRPGRGAASIVLDHAGRVWVATFDTTARGGGGLGRGVSAWDGTSWTNYEAEYVEALGTTEPASLIAGADGSLWATTSFRFARFEAGRWTPVEMTGTGAWSWPSVVDAEGRLWSVPGACPECGVAVSRFDGPGWTTWDESDGLPGPDEVGYRWASMLAGPEYVLAATEAGLYRLDGDSWRRLQLPGPSVGSPAGVDAPGRVGALAAVSRTEVWAATQPELDPYALGSSDAGLYRFDGVAWHREELPIETVVRQLALAPDGALWAASDAGPLVRRDGRWIDLGEVVARVVPRGSDDGLDRDCASAISIGTDGVVYFVGQRSSSRIVALLPVGSSWSASLHSAPRRVLECPTVLAVTGDGTAWITQRGGDLPLRRSSGEAWEMVRPRETLQARDQSDASAIAVDQDGLLWASVLRFDPTASAGPGDVELLQLVGSDWVSHGRGAGLGGASSMAFAPDGSLIVVGDGVARFAGGRWHHALQGVWLEHVSVAPDGWIWAAGPSIYAIPGSLLGS